MAIEYVRLEAADRAEIWQQRLYELERNAFRQEVDLAILKAEQAASPPPDRAAFDDQIALLEDALVGKGRRHAALVSEIGKLGG